MTDHDQSAQRPDIFNSPEVARWHANVLEAHIKMAEAYPKTVLLLAGGALTLSVSLLGQILGERAPQSVYLLWISWLSLVASLGSIAVAMLLSLGDLERASHNFVDLILGKYKLNPRRMQWIKGLNIGAAATLFTGLLAIALFSLLNLRKESDMSDKNKVIIPVQKPSPGVRHDSFVVGPPPIISQPVQQPAQQPAPATQQAPKIPPATTKK